MEKTPLNKTPMLTSSINVDIWVDVTSNDFFISGSNTETKFPKN